MTCTTYPDCFHCPHPDCFVEGVIPSGKTKESENERKRLYYQKNREKIRAKQRAKRYAEKYE